MKRDYTDAERIKLLELALESFPDHLGASLVLAAPQPVAGPPRWAPAGGARNIPVSRGYAPGTTRKQSATRCSRSFQLGRGSLD